MVPQKRKIHTTYFLRSAFTGMALLCLALIGSAQVDNVYVYGTVKDHSTAKKLGGVTVVVYKNGAKLTEVVTNGSGKYEVNLDYGSDYKLIYQQGGMVSKNITIDTRNIPEEERLGGHGMNIEMTLFNDLPGIDFSILNNPIGKAKFDASTNEVTWDLEYTNQIRNEIARLMKMYEDRKKREANLEEDFAKLVQQGDAAMASGDFRKAVDSFTEALTLKPKEPIATAKLSDAQMRLTAQENEQKREQEYATLIKDADGLFAKKDYEASKAKYQAALAVKESEAYPKQRIAEINTLIAEAAKKAEEERLARELQAKYDAAIKAGDASFKAEKYEEARSSFNEALALKKDEQYPKDKLAEITAKLEELAKKAEEERKAKELQQKYDAAIKAGDQAFNSAKYEDARAKYTEALGLKADEKYPKDQLTAIDKKLEELAKKAEEERLKKELDDKYNAAIAAADAGFKAADYEAARAKYNEALELKKEEKYPKDQLAAIDRKLEELAKKAEEERKQRELDERYNGVIAQADAAFKGADYEEARSKYTEAGGLKPAERYPKDQLAAIDAKLEELRRKEEEERKQRELDEKYTAALTAADKAFDDAKYEDARARYTEASGLKPAERYPKDRLKAIDDRLAEIARKAEEERKARELEEKYTAAIDRADKAFGKQDWEPAKAAYKEAAVLKPAEAYPPQRIAEIDATLAELARKAEEERKAKELEDRYKALIASADKSFGAEKWSAAINDYKDALALKPEEQYPKDRIATIEGKLDQAAKEKAEAERLAREAQEREQQYNDAMAKGDIAMGREDFDKARSSYNDALAIRPDAAPPKDKLAEIDRILAERASSAEAARLAAEKAERDRIAREAAELEQRYLGLISKGDKAFDRDDLDQAKASFKDALALRPGEQYPTDRLAAIEKRRKELAEMDQAAREAAEREAAERARLEEERRQREAQAAEVEARYRDLVARADLAFDADQFDKARSNYTEALGVKPGEQYPKDRLAAIDAELARRAKEASASDREAEERRRAEEERRLREQQEAEAARLAAEEAARARESDKARDERYRSVIVDAEAKLADQRYEEARSLFYQALDIKPAETYPKAKIDQIDKLIAEQERMRREAELAAQRARDNEKQVPVSNSKTIDIRKEQEAEQFMREARLREEADKWERIKKLKRELNDQEVEHETSAYERRQQGVREKEQYQGASQQLYSGSDESRRANADAIAQQKKALADAERERAARAATMRSQAYDDKLNTERDKDRTFMTWEEKQRAKARETESEKTALLDQDAVRSAEEQDRIQRERDRVEAEREALDRMAGKGNALSGELRDQLEDERRLREARESQMIAKSKTERETAAAQLRTTPISGPKDYQDYKLSKLAEEYPQGVTEESYTEGNKVIILRVVVNGNKADEYSKVIAKWGTYYFKNGHSITESIWVRDTEGN